MDARGEIKNKEYQKPAVESRLGWFKCRSLAAWVRKVTGPRRQSQAGTRT